MTMLLASCRSQTKGKQSFEVKIAYNFKDTCMSFKNDSGSLVSFYRDVEIIENTVTDTLRIGFSIVRPKQTGTIIIYQSDTARDKSLYTDPAYIEHLFKTDHPNARTKYLCIHSKNEGSKPSIQGDRYLIIRLYTRRYKY
jgi:hypothetical protein